MKIISIILVGAIWLLTAATHQISAQELFNGVVTYKMSMNGAAAQTYTVYYRGHDQMTDMPHNKMRMLYLSEEKKMYSIMSMIGQTYCKQFRFRCRDSVR